VRTTRPIAVRHDAVSRSATVMRIGGGGDRVGGLACHGATSPAGAGHGHAPQTVAIEPLSIERVRRLCNRQQVQERGHSFFVPYLTQCMRWYNVAHNWYFEN
jgi:hypothetical protein